MCEVSSWKMKKWTSERWDSFWIFWEIVHVQLPRLYLIFGGSALHLQESRLILFTKSEMTSFCVGKPLLFKSTGCFGYKTVICGGEIHLVDSIKFSIALKNTPGNVPIYEKPGSTKEYVFFQEPSRNSRVKKVKYRVGKELCMYIHILWNSATVAKNLSRKNVCIYKYNYIFMLCSIIQSYCKT